MRDTIRTVLNFHLKRHSHGVKASSFFTGKTHIGADTTLTLDDLYKEANVVFWALTSYKVNQKLDPSNPEDAKMIPVWGDACNKVKSAHINKDTNELFWKNTSYKVGQKLDPKIPADKAMIPKWLDANKIIKAKYENLPRTPVGTSISQVLPKTAPSLPEVHAVQAELHQAEAQANKVIATETAKAAIVAASEGNTEKAADLTAQSNAANEKSQVHQEQADTHKEILTNLNDVHSLNALAYLAAKYWSKTKEASKYFGWSIKKDGTVDTKWTDSVQEINNWFGSLGVGDQKDVIWGLYWDYDKRDAQGVLIPIDTYSPEITQAIADNALNNALGKARASLKDTYTPQPQPTQVASGGGAAIALMVVLGGGLAMAAASSKR